MREAKGIKMPAPLLSKKGSRRDFLRNTTLTALAGGTLACTIDDSGARNTKAGEKDHSGGTMAPNPAPVSAAAAADAMDRGHEAKADEAAAKSAGRQP